MKTGRVWRLATAMVTIELIAGMQVYVSATITPLLAAELGGQRLYGLSAAAAQTAMFLSLPLGPAMMRRWSGGRLLTVFTAIGVVAACCAAAAQTMPLYIVARAMSGLASGALASVGMGVLADELDGRARRFTLAANNLMWVASSLAGPAYAAWVAAALSWRVALVAYLPVLVAARLVIIRELAHSSPSESSGQLPWRWAVMLATGILLLGIRPPTDLLGMGEVLAGLVLMAMATERLVPEQVLSRRATGGAAAVRTLAGAAAILFGADAIITIVAHDLLGLGAHQIGQLLTAGGLTWAVVGLAAAGRPCSARRFAWQAPLALLMMGLGSALMAYATNHQPHALLAGWMVMNLGMGLVYLDAMNLAFDDTLPNALPPAIAGATIAFVEPLAGAFTGTLASGLVSAGAHHAGIVFILLAAFTIPAAHTASRVHTP